MILFVNYHSCFQLFQCCCFADVLVSSVPVFLYSYSLVFLMFSALFLFSVVLLFRCSCFPSPFQMFLFSFVSLFRCSCFPLFSFSDVPVFLCLSFQMFLFSIVLLFRCSCFPLSLFSDVPVFYCSPFQMFLFSFVCTIRCSCFSVFPFLDVPDFQCSSFSVLAVWTLRPVGVGCVDGTKTVASWSYLWEKTGYSLVHSDIQVCTYHTRQDWNARDTKVSSLKTAEKKIGLDCSSVFSL